MFNKQGTPQPIKIASGLCEECGKKSATTLVDGRMICDSCKGKLLKEDQKHGQLSPKS